MQDPACPPLPSRRIFLRRLFRSILLASAVIAVSLAIGILGYHELAGLPWVDSLLNASMILGGMGPVDALATTRAKLFASAYALYSGVVLLASVAVVISPVVHRLLHHYHLDVGEDRDE